MRGGEEAPLKLSSEEGKNDAKKADLLLQGWVGGEGQQQPGRL